MNTISEHRKYLNEVLMLEWAKEFKPHELVYDIGKSTTWDYESFFNCRFKTIDRNANLSPNIVADVENLVELIEDADGIILNGVFEQCDDPWKLMRGVNHLIKKGGRILVGLASNNMEPYGPNDKWRVTYDGAKAYMDGFTVDRFDVFPNYFFLTGVKK